MSHLPLITVEIKKVRRSRILLILALAVIILWLPSIVNSHMNFNMQAEGISPEDNFFIQGFMAMVWFIFPASMVVITVLLSQTERRNNGILKMLTLPVSTAVLCFAKFIVLLLFSAVEFLMSAGMYYVGAMIASHTQNYDFILSPLFIFREAGIMWVSSIPMLAFFWMLAICIQTPIFAIGTGFASIVPSVLMINTKVWFAYPMAYPFFVITAEYGKLATNFSSVEIELIPWIPVAVFITGTCLAISCTWFGKAERA